MSPQRKWTLIVLAGAVALAALMIALRPSPKEQPRDERAPLVRTVPLKPGTRALPVAGSGTVQPTEEVTISAQVSGRLVYVSPQFREGSLVRAGAPLLRIDPADYRNRVRTAQADVAAQEVAVLQAREEAQIAKDELGRFARREDAGSLVDQTADANDYASRILAPRELADDAAAANRRTDEAPPPARLATREPQLQSARAARERAKAQLADARLALGRTQVSAPFTGLVRSENAAVGKLVQPGQELGSIVSAASFEVRVALTEGEAALIPGLLSSARGRIPASVFSDYGGRTWRWNAYVDRADAILDEQTRTIDVFLRVPNPLRSGIPVGSDAGGTAPPLLMGSFVRAEITGSAGEPYFSVPVEALRPGNAVWVVRKNRLHILPVRILQRTDRMAHVTTPTLSQGGAVVTSALRAPVDGMKVRIEDPAQSGGKPPAEKPKAAPGE